MNSEQVQEIFIDDIIPNRFQPRLTFDEKALQELSESIKVHGVIQPLVLRKVGNKYEIIAGERRYKASCMAGLKKVPAIVRELTDNESAEIALIENIQRKNLSSIEEAQSYKNLLERGYLTQDALAQKLGISQSTIANKLRLLNLCDEVQNALLNEKISERHARSLLQIDNPDDQKKMLNRVIKERLTVKQLDNEIKKLLAGNDDEGDREKLDGGEKTMDTTNTEKKENRSIFGFPIDPPTDLESSAPNLAVGPEEFEPPVSFNPFSGDIKTDEGNKQDNQTKDENTDTIETFDIFGDVVSSDQTNFETENEQANTDENFVKSIGDQINNIRSAVRTAETDGFRVEMEEYDFEDMYQMVIKIKK